MSVDNGDEVQQLSRQLADTLGSGLTALAITIGVDLGLFEKMASYDRPQTSAQIAVDTGCKERLDFFKSQ